MRELILRDGACGRGDVALTISEKPNNGLAGSVWDCGELSAEMFWQKFDFRHKQARVLEIGSGTGIGGIAAAVAGAEAMLTDLCPALPLIRENVKVNIAAIDRGQGSVKKVAILDVMDACAHAGESSTGCAVSEVDSDIACFLPNIILCADVTYNTEILKGVVRTTRNIAHLVESRALVQGNRFRTSS